MISYQLTGEEKLRAFLVNGPKEVRQGLKKEIDRLAILVQGRAKENVSGSHLKVRTGRLRRSITVRRGSLAAGGDYHAEVGSNVKYAAAHEYGFFGNVQVKAHKRTITQVYGRSVSPVTAKVQSYTRAMWLEEKSFLRDALLDYQDEIGNSILAYITKTLAAQLNKGK